MKQNVFNDSGIIQELSENKNQTIKSVGNGFNNFALQAVRFNLVQNDTRQHIHAVDVSGIRFLLEQRLKIIIDQVWRDQRESSGFALFNKRR